MSTSTVTEFRTAATSRLKEIAAKLDDITTNGMKIDNGNIEVPESAAVEFKSLIAEQKSIRGQLDDFSEAGSLSAFLKQLEDADNEPATDRSVAAATAIAALRGGVEYKSIGTRFIESDAFKSRDRASGVTREVFELAEDLSSQGLWHPGLEKKDLYTSAGGTLTNFAFGHPQREPLVPRAYRTARVRDLFPVATTNANLIEYVRVLGYVDGVNNAAPVAERDEAGTGFGLKPHTQLLLQPAQSPLRTIAHYELAHRNTLADEPQLRSIIDTELLYGLRLVEDAQILNGDGTGENILGIMRTPGIQQYPGTPLPNPSPVLATDTIVDAVRRAATRVMMAYYEPTGVVVHPFDWEQMELTKDAQRNYILSMNVSVGAEKRIWQMPVVASPAMLQGRALVGAFGLGAKIYDREQANIRIAEQHADLFIRNAVAILAEERVGLTVSRPESFIDVDLEAGAAV